MPCYHIIIDGVIVLLEKACGVCVSERQEQVIQLHLLRVTYFVGHLFAKNQICMILMLCIIKSIRIVL